MSPDKPRELGHAGDEIFDFLERRLTPQREREIEAHLGECRDCAALFSSARKLHDDVIAQRARHLSPDRLLELADTPGASPDTPEAAHLAACSLCHDQLQHLQSLAPPPDLVPTEPAAAAPSPPVLGRAPAPTEPRGLRAALRGLFGRAPRWGWAGVAVAAASLLFAISTRGPDSSLVRLARVAPLELQWARGGEPSDPDPDYRAGLRAYADGDFELAEIDLERAALSNPSHEELFLYLGSAQLLLARADRAADTLRRAIRNASDPVIADEARWQLANVHLVAGSEEDATALLRAIAAEGLARAPDAESLLRALDSRPR